MALFENGDYETRPWLYRDNAIPHYYGDTVRTLFLAAGCLVLFGAPLYVNDIYPILPFVIIGAFAILLAASLTSPRSNAFIIVDAVLASIGLLVFQYWALWEYGNAPLSRIFAFREIIAIIFFFALYFSIKTLRAMSNGIMGPVDSIRQMKEDPYEDKKSPLGTTRDEADKQEEHREELREARVEQELFQD